MDRLPSLNSIRIFETVARLLSYTAAAKELHVTTSAISHRIKDLENTLGAILIDRTAQRIYLTPIGKQYYEQIAQGLMQLTSATNALHRAKGARILRISSAPTLTSRWLLPRLERFMSEFPDIHVELSAILNTEDFTKGNFDIAIRYLRSIPSGLHAVPLGPNHVFPICSPRLLKGKHALRTPLDLKHHTLIDARELPGIEERFVVWNGWLKAARYSQVEGKNELVLFPRWLMMQAVDQGLGIGLARTLPASDDLISKRLICPFGPALPLSVTFYTVCPESTAHNPEIVIFRDWVLAEAQKSIATIKLPVGR